MTRALIIVDVQNEYFPEGAIPLVGSDVALAEVQKVLAYFRETNQHIVHIQHFERDVEAGYFTKGTHGAEIHSTVKPRDGEAHFTKHTPNSFAGTPLLGHLLERKITELVVVGMMTHMCIDSTVRAAFDAGFTVQLVGAACATYDQEFKGATVPAASVNAAFFAAIDGTFATVVSSDEVCG